MKRRRRARRIALVEKMNHLSNEWALWPSALFLTRESSLLGPGSSLALPRSLVRDTIHPAGDPVVTGLLEEG
jgi:hypothetical protein